MIESLLRQVDTARVLAASAVMQMDLSNVNELLVLQNLSHFAARQATEPGRELSSSALKRLLAADEVGGPAVLGDLDPFEGFPVVEVPVPPRRYLVLEGMATDSADIAARLLRSIFASRQSTFPAQYRVAVSAAARFLLGLSDSLARQFGRSVDDRAPSLTRRVTVPSGTRIATLTQRLVFSPGALFAGRSISEVQFLTDSLVWRHGEIGPIGPDGLGGSVDDALNAQAESQPDDIFAMMTDAAADADSTLLVRPIVATHLGLVVASPTSLAASLRHLVVVLAQQHNCVDQLVDALTESAVTDLRFLLEPMTDLPLRTVPTTAAETGRGMKPADDSAAEPDGVSGFAEPRRRGGVAEGRGNSRDVESDQVGVRGLVRLTAPFDEDKALDVRLTVDTLDHYDAGTVWGSSTTPQVELAPLGLPPERVLVIDTHLGVGRDFLYLGGDEDSPGLFASLSDMATLMLAPGTDRLTLWYFAKALHRLHRSTRVITFSVVDTFAIYRGAHESFYLSDDAAPQLLNGLFAVEGVAGVGGGGRAGPWVGVEVFR